MQEEERIINPVLKFKHTHMHNSLHQANRTRKTQKEKEENIEGKAKNIFKQPL